MLTQRWVRLSVAVLTAVSLSASGAEALVIDDLTVGDSFTTPYTDHALSVVQSGLDADHVWGGVRELRFPMNFSTTEASTAILDTSAGLVRFENTGLSGGSSVALEYGGNATGGLEMGLDLTGGGYDRILVDILQLGPSAKGSTPEIMQLGANLFTLERDAEGEVVASRYSNIEIDLAATDTPYTATLLLDERLGSADLAEIDGISISVYPFGTGGSVSIGSIRIVPEPASLAMLGLAGVAMLWRRRRTEAAAGPAVGD